MFGPTADFSTFHAVGLKPAYMRFMIAFVMDRETEESAKIDSVSIPWHRLDYTDRP